MIRVLFFIRISLESPSEAKMQQKGLESASHVSRETIKLRGFTYQE